MSNERQYKRIHGLSNYLICDDGTIISLFLDRELHGTVDAGGYVKVTLKNDDDQLMYANIHRLVAEAFCHKPESDETLEVNHINGDKEDNRASNLEWIPHNENLKHAFETGLRKQDVSARAVIATNMETGEQLEFSSIYRASRFLNVSQGNICMCCKKKRPHANGFYWDYKEGE